MQGIQLIGGEAIQVRQTGKCTLYAGVFSDSSLRERQQLLKSVWGWVGITVTRTTSSANHEALEVRYSGLTLGS